MTTLVNTVVDLLQFIGALIVLTLIFGPFFIPKTWPTMRTRGYAAGVADSIIREHVEDVVTHDAVARELRPEIRANIEVAVGTHRMT